MSQLKQPHERINRMTDVKELFHSNLHEVFSERDPERRRAAIERMYTQDVTLVNPDGEVTGRQALSDAAQKVLDGAPADFTLEEDGPGYVGTGTYARAWSFGPPGSPVAHGIDILTIRDGRVSVLRTLLAAETDA
jgi:SnoaL-like domain